MSFFDFLLNPSVRGLLATLSGRSNHDALLLLGNPFQIRQNEIDFQKKENFFNGFLIRVMEKIVRSDRN